MALNISNTLSNSTSDSSNITNDGSPLLLLDQSFFKQLFPLETEETLCKWIETLRNEEFDCIEDLTAFGENNPGWDKLDLPLDAKSIIKGYIVQAHRALYTNVSSLPASIRRSVNQIDIIVMDVSGSMKSRSTLDVDKTREDVSKMLFHTLIDKLLAMELSHAVGLLAFGERITPISITTHYESFHDELGRLDACEGSTALFDAINSAVDMIETYYSDQAAINNLSSDVVKRIFVLTDGVDNASKKRPWQVAQVLQEHNVLLDAIPIAGSFDSQANRTLQVLCSASGGMCFAAVSQDQAVNLFEREAALHVAYREAVNTELVPRIRNAQAMDDLVRGTAKLQTDGTSGGGTGVSGGVVQQLTSATNKAMTTPCISSAQLLSQDTSATKSSSRSSAAVKRILREYRDFCSSPPAHWKAFVSAEDCCVWKVVLSGLVEPACYQDGRWLLSVQFPPDYPFRAPRVRFETPIYHCNVSVDGAICLDKLKDDWSPSTTMVKLVEEIESMLKRPNEFGFLDAVKGSQYTDWLRNGVTTYFDEASKFTQQHCSESFADLAAKYNLGSEEEEVDDSKAPIS
eukprot:gene24412-32859_t